MGTQSVLSIAQIASFIGTHSDFYCWEKVKFVAGA